MTARCNKEAYCPDLSDVKCQLEDCKENLHFKCTDNSGCIHNSLVCDGHEQCPDGSDEKQDCDICPKAIGHPPRPISQQWAANWKCRHRSKNYDTSVLGSRNMSESSTGTLAETSVPFAATEETTSAKAFLMSKTAVKCLPGGRKC